jgi:hypothetical protein
LGHGPLSKSPNKTNKRDFNNIYMVDYKNISKYMAICGCGGYIFTTLVGGIACTNPNCPINICEERVHIPEKGSTSSSYVYTYAPILTVSGTPTVSTTTTTIYPYTNLNSQNNGVET